ncbi:Trm112 family protein [Actinomycetospora lutea]|uniref:Trm112 family protein n=1 Tax=Actinomycetospora lutea TaxID=663604 RepID=UPI0023670543|nr:Trm112 family protein [Actinomycetospora lutea]MDD7940022.1 Trm112 family protein [Actinomycetospora lutea]
MPLGLDPDLLEILACPAPDHGALRPGTPEDAEAAMSPVLTCTVCDRRYPVTDGIPVLLLSEATGGPEQSSGTRSAAEPDPSSQG